MEIYKPLYRITIEHDYFNNRACPALSLRITSQGLQLARQRTLLFRQTAVNEWTLLYDSTDPGVDTERDMLEFSLNITDPILHSIRNGMVYILQVLICCNFPQRRKKWRKE